MQISRQKPCFSQRKIYHTKYIFTSYYFKMDLSIEQIKHLAKLSKIALSPEEEQKYAQQLGSILSFLDTLTLEEKEGIPTE